MTFRITYGSCRFRLPITVNWSASAWVSPSSRTILTNSAISSPRWVISTPITWMASISGGSAISISYTATFAAISPRIGSPGMTYCRPTRVAFQGICVCCVITSVCARRSCALLAGRLVSKTPSTMRSTKRRSVDCSFGGRTGPKRFGGWLIASIRGVVAASSTRRSARRTLGFRGLAVASIFPIAGSGTMGG